ncbi:hypothetical protein PLESTB_001937900 [Pleodorina starrii]|uniref:DUF305 domain-containing protein n=1 Tax=Pleodorina starrii TaxID=330485 RepID=A0A9W6C2U4_9CHLO|nr:hypothetical protein PLESTB_001926100 [Pleodorina starrii]GLC62700.1 hypothetical protein PLESTB_001929300 [Pleodorina starrii]GLC62719.1 hypothetical protein PLESTB_001931500 [Pleodorina starrii]GLC62778.1 hypothetical protein PLESTB_001937900 [Pleodorina starrii]
MNHDRMNGGSYGRFAAMIFTSTVVMFGLMYLNTWSLDHVFFSQTRMWMALYMGGAMALIMLAFMLGMYRNRRANLMVAGLALLAFVLGVFLVRSQATVDDTAWMKAMIPHHSIAILTSTRANISDPRVQALADSIVEAQTLEIAEMKALIADLQVAQLFQQFHHLAEHDPLAILITGFNRRLHTASGVVLDQKTFYRAQGGSDGSGLVQHINTIATILDHARHTLNLTVQT